MSIEQWAVICMASLGCFNGICWLFCYQFHRDFAREHRGCEDARSCLSHECIRLRNENEALLKKYTTQGHDSALGATSQPVGGDPSTLSYRRVDSRPPEPEPPVRDPRQSPAAHDAVRFGDGEEWHVESVSTGYISVVGPDAGFYPNTTIKQHRQRVGAFRLEDWRTNVAEATVIAKSGRPVNTGSVPYRPTEGGE